MKDAWTWITLVIVFLAITVLARALKAASIEAPAKPVAPGRLCRLPVLGATIDELKGGKSTLTCVPNGDAQADLLVTIDGKPIVYFTADKPGKYAILMHLWRPASIEGIRADVEVREIKPPDPIKPPPPPATEEKFWLIPVWETSTPDRLTSSLLADLDLQRRLHLAGHHWAPTDKDATQETAQAVGLWVARAKLDMATAGTTEPWLIVVAEAATQAAYSGPLKYDSSSLFALIDKLGGKHVP